MSKYPQDVLVRKAATSTSIVDLMRQVGAPMGSGPRRYLLARLAHYGIDTSHFREEPLPERPQRSYSKEILTEAAAQSTSIREMFVHMGIPPDDGPYWHVKQKLDRFGIDTSHFAPGRGRAEENLFPEGVLTRAVAASHSLAGVLRQLGVRHVNGTALAKAKRSIDEYGLSTEHFTGQGHYRGSTSPRRMGAHEILVRLARGSRRTPTRLLRRALDEIRAPRVCAECGLGEIWQDKHLVLEIDHIDGDRTNNLPENLRYLCPSCHSQTRTFSKRHHGNQ